MPPKRKKKIAGEGHQAKKGRLSKATAPPDGKLDSLSKPAPKKNLDHFPFMELAPETRNQIYELLLVDPNEVHILSDWTWADPTIKHVSKMEYAGVSGYLNVRPCLVLPNPHTTLQANILLASKAIHNEASAFLWEQPFHLATPRVLYFWLDVMRPATIARLQHITVDAKMFGVADQGKLDWLYFDPLRKAVNLRRLHLDFRFTSSLSHFKSDTKVAYRVGYELWSAMGPLIATIVHRHGLKAITSIIKLQDTNLKGPPAYQITHPWNPHRQNNVLGAIRNRLARLINADNKRKNTHWIL